ncbi:acid-sensing ion channel 3 [Plakobranchus ocellatus]|uniref:Acid-sensing ion channel 3 n=1 Tax=Plakobranchus ocellatus TaxID=259542 RepID=A0AAV4D5L8_9GAST|nr:acid-sensing ion channel 3 [Plakobranchus ocellatus]
MVRFDIHEHPSKMSGGKVNNLDVYGDTSALPDNFDNLSDSKATKEESSMEVGDCPALEVGNGQNEDRQSEKSPENLSDVWWRFLRETSLHGCKNVQERWIVKRVVWSCVILLMAAALGWSLLQLLLRYQEHPFVSVFKFQRENAILAPGLSFCLPARFNKHKLLGSRKAYQMFAYDYTGVHLHPEEDREGRSRKEFLEQMKTWEKQLENVTVQRARREIGFTRKEVFSYAGLLKGGREYNILNKLLQFDLDSKTCWSVQWLLPDVEVERGTDSEESFEDSDNPGEFEDIQVAGETTEDGIDFGNTNKSSGHKFPGGGVRNKTAALVNVTEETSPSTSPFFPASTTTSGKVVETNFTTPTKNAVSDRATHDDVDVEREGEEEDDAEINMELIRDSAKSDLLRLDPRDTIFLVVDIKQNSWLTEPYVGGLELYLHDPIGGYWSASPIHIRPGTFTSIHYTTTKYKFLPPPYKSFSSGESEFGKASQNTGCVDTTAPGFQTPMVSARKAFYSSDTCMSEYAANISIKQCGCGADAFFSHLHGKKECSVIQHKKCLLRVLDREYARLQRQLANGRATHVCPQSCSYTTFETKMSTADYPSLIRRREYAYWMNLDENMVEKNILAIQIHPQGLMTNTVEHVPELTVLSILGSVGGLMGLCLGASFLTLTEFLEAVVMSVWIIYQKLICRKPH